MRGKGKKKKEMKYRRKSKDRKQEEKNSKVSENNYTMKEAKERINEKIEEYISHSGKKKGMLCIYLLNFDKFTTWHSVFLATFHQRIHILNNDKGSLLQGDNTQMVIVWVAVCERAVPWPDRVLQAQ